MSQRLYIFIAALSGIIAGFLTIHSFLAHSWTSMIFWIIAGLILLNLSPNRKSGLYAAAVFGFFDIATWLMSGFQGTEAALSGFFILTIVLSILGALCGMIGAMIFYRLFR